MTTHITKTWFDGDKVVTQEIPESEVYKQEPVAWMDEFGNVFPLGAQRGPKYLNEPMKPLYTTPPAAQRQPLTDEQRRNIVRANKMRHDSDEIDPYGVIDDVEAAHGITGEKT
jgi:hypothetical protein